LDRQTGMGEELTNGGKKNGPEKVKHDRWKQRERAAPRGLLGNRVHSRAHKEKSISRSFSRQEGMDDCVLPKGEGTIKGGRIIRGSRRTPKLWWLTGTRK